MFETNLNHFLQLSSKIIEEGRSQNESKSKTRARTRSVLHNSILSGNEEHMGKTNASKELVNYSSKIKRESVHQQTESLAKKPSTFSETQKKILKFIHNQVSSTNETQFDKHTTSLFTLPTFGDFDKKNSARKSEIKETFVNNQTEFLNMNPDCAVARYISDSFKATNLNFIQKRTKASIQMNLTKKLGDLKPTTHPEYTKIHGTMLSYELWGTKRRIRYRHQIKTINNPMRSPEKPGKDKCSSNLDTSLDLNAALGEDIDVTSDISTKPTLNYLKRNSYLRSSSLVELRQIKPTPSNLLKDKTESVSKFEDSKMVLSHHKKLDSLKTDRMQIKANQKSNKMMTRQNDYSNMLFRRAS